LLKRVLVEAPGIEFQSRVCGKFARRLEIARIVLNYRGAMKVPTRPGEPRRCPVRQSAWHWAGTGDPTCQPGADAYGYAFSSKKMTVDFDYWKPQARVTEAHLRVFAAKIRRDFPDRPESLHRVLLAFDVAANFIGAANRAKLEKWRLALLRSDFSSLGTRKGTAKSDARAAQARLELLADSLLALQDVPGFDERLVTLRHSQAHWEGWYGELTAGGLLSQRGLLRRIVIPTVGAPKGVNFDFDLQVDGIAISCETKTKIRTTKLDPRTLEEALCDARDQLPPSGPSIIWLEIPDHWITSGMFEMNIQDALLKFTPRKRGVTAVTLHWLDWLMPDDARGQTQWIVTSRVFSQPLSHAESDLALFHAYKSQLGGAPLPSMLLVGNFASGTSVAT
jgi:hypothetical protein